MKGLAMYRTILAQNVSYERLVLDWLQDDAQDELAVQKAKGPEPEPLTEEAAKEGTDAT